jgi:hypothetical protein
MACTQTTPVADRDGWGNNMEAEKEEADARAAIYTPLSKDVTL